MTSFSVWSPAARDVVVTTGRDATGMHRGSDGWWRAELPDVGHGDDYTFTVDGEGPLPDPRSTWQPHGVHGASRVYEQDRFRWSDGGWRGIVLPGSVFYELHVGTFTDEGTLDAAIGRLDHLVGLGVDLVELMPVAAFPGKHGWGYDGVHPFAVHEPYGGPDALKRFVDACHGRGLGVVLDVVYNHLGPSGNHLPAFGPYFTERHQTPWGAAVNLDDEGSAEVRRWIVDNALMWLRDFHIDGLRLDAVHAMVDDSEEHVLSQLSGEVDALSARLRRPLLLIAESDLNDPAMVTPRECGGLGMTGQWSDDFHHALHTLLTGEGQGYYADFAADPYLALAGTLTEAFFHAGTWSSFRGADHGRPVDTSRFPGYRFLGYLQDHDQVGNRAMGDRITASVSPGLVRIGAALVLTAPFTPMLFMGEEWAAATPWQYFTDHQEPALADAVRTGRRHEFAEHGWAEEDVPDPQDPATLARSCLDWSELDREPHLAALAWYRELLRLRRAEPELADPRLDHVQVRYDAAARWVVVHRGALRVACNLGAGEQAVPLDTPALEVLASSGDGRPEGAALVMSAESVAVVRVGPAGSGAGATAATPK
ncbi:MAG: maltooligosyltrehalose trehalohydrolase [Actinomycetota bacterium]|nr:maltooligosyltrehalose trehalohydrolase [Actinomycetota bacterium]